MKHRQLAWLILVSILWGMFVGGFAAGIPISLIAAIAPNHPSLFIIPILLGVPCGVYGGSSLLQKKLRPFRELEAANPKNCPTCGYNLQGLPKPRCPECGYWFKRPPKIEKVEPTDG